MLVVTPSKKIGVGPRATVHAGNTNAGTAVAIKELNESTRINGPARERMFQAAESWGRLEHAHLVRVLDVVRDQCWIIMDPMSSNATQLIGQGPLGSDRVADILRGLLESLKYLHEARLLHGNIKPTNILFDSQGQARLSDGFAISLDQPSTFPTSGDAWKYTAPEIASSDGYQPDCGLDIYCLGFIMFELLVGPRFGAVFPGVGAQAKDNHPSWLQWHGSPLKTPAVGEVVRDCPAELARVIDRMVTKDPLSRYHHCQQALDHLALVSMTARNGVSSSAAESVSRSRTPELPEAPMAGAESNDPANDTSVPPPTTGMVLLIASGDGAGCWLGTDDDQATVGYDGRGTIDWVVPGSESKWNSLIHLKRGPDGWCAQAGQQARLFVNWSPADDVQAIRSGDILRFSWRGPDLQFLLRSGSKNVRELAEQYLKKVRRPVDGKREAVQGPRSAGDERGPGGCAGAKKGVPPSSSPPSSPMAATNAAVPTKRREVPPPAAVPTSKADQPSSQNATPTKAPAPPKAAPPKAVPPKAVRPQSLPPKPPLPTHRQGLDESPSRWQYLCSPKLWDKKTQNWAAGIATFLVLGPLVLWFPSGGSSSSSADGQDPQPTTVPARGAPASATPPAAQDPAADRAHEERPQGEADAAKPTDAS